MSDKSPKPCTPKGCSASKTSRRSSADRVPVFGPFQENIRTPLGPHLKQGLNDYAAARRLPQILDYFQPDADFGPILAYPARPWIPWAGTPSSGGHASTIDHDVSICRNGILEAEEYDEFIQDPSDLHAAQVAPRSFKRWRLLETLPWALHCGRVDELVLRFARECAIRSTWSPRRRAAERVVGSQVQYWGELKARAIRCFAGWDCRRSTSSAHARGTHQFCRYAPAPEQAARRAGSATRIFVEYGEGSAAPPCPSAGYGCTSHPRIYVRRAVQGIYWPYCAKG